MDDVMFLHNLPGNGDSTIHSLKVTLGEAAWIWHHCVHSNQFDSLGAVRTGAEADVYDCLVESLDSLKQLDGKNQMFNWLAQVYVRIGH